MDLHSLFNTFSTDPRLKLVKSLIPYTTNSTLIDVSIKNRSIEEKLYKTDETLLNTLTRGISFILINDELSWARKGQKKFFELKPLQCPSFPSHTKLFKSQKANGENAQISYIPQIDSWIIASKNVSLAARCESDLALYSELRFNFAKLIASTWFSMLSTVNSVALKSELVGHTLIGEYVGNPDCQHIIKYTKTTILFFGLVKNDSSAFCCSLDVAQGFFRRFTLDCTRSEEIKIEFVNGKADFLGIIEEIQDLSMEVAQEGFVLYFCAEETLWMCKVKTLEYKIMRKLREIMKKEKGKTALERFNEYVKAQEKKCRRDLGEFTKKAQLMLQDLNSVMEVQNNFASILEEQRGEKVFFTIGIPGIGKSSLATKLKEMYNELCVISSDEIRYAEMQKLLNKNPNLLQTELFNRTSKSSQKNFNSQIGSSSFPLYADKNFPPNGLSSLTAALSGRNTTLIGLYQKSTGLQINDKFWPFSLEVLYTCMQRLITRKDHPLLRLEDSVKSCQITIFMYNLYQGHQFSWYLRNGVSKIVPVNFVNEESVKIPTEFRKKAEKILRNLKAGKNPAIEKVAKLVLTVKTDDLVFEPLKIGEKVPLYLGIEAEVPVVSIAVKTLGEIFKVFGDKKGIQEDFEEFCGLSPGIKPLKLTKSGWNIPSPLHITLLFIGCNSKVLHSEQYKNFLIGKVYSFVFTHIVYCPGKIVIGKVRFCGEEPLVSNKNPHLTLFSRKAANKVSNDVLDCLEFTEKPSVQKCVFGECFCLPVEFEQFSGLTKEFY